MCSSNPRIPAPPLPVAPPPPPPQITVAPAPKIPQMSAMQNEQLRPDNPTNRRRRQGNRQRGKAILKIPLNTSSGGINA